MRFQPSKTLKNLPFLSSSKKRSNHFSLTSLQNPFKKRKKTCPFRSRKFYLLPLLQSQ
jgi:hypothetical protein